MDIIGRNARMTKHSKNIITSTAVLAIASLLLMAALDYTATLAAALSIIMAVSMVGILPAEKRRLIVTAAAMALPIASIGILTDPWPIMIMIAVPVIIISYIGMARYQ